MTRAFTILRILRINMYLWFSIFFMSSCNTSSEKDTSHKSSNHSVSKVESQFVKKSNMRVDTVIISDMKFQPEEIKVRKGNIVIWINKDLVAHCVTELNSQAWTSSTIPPDRSWKMTVTQSSNYHCAIHPVMKGKIVMK